MRTMGSHHPISDPSGSAVHQGGIARGEPGAGTAAGRQRRRPFGRALYVAFLLAFVALALWLATIEIEGALADFVLRFGYIGYLGAACIAGINVIVPTTHLIFTTPLLNAGLDPWGMVACGAAGATLADAIGYALGSSGRQALSERYAGIADRLASAVRRRPRLAPALLFLWAAFAPLPNEILVIPAGILGYGLGRTTLLTFSGNIVFNTMAIVLGLSVV